MNKVTKREQFMLFILGMILISVLFYVVIWTPSQTRKLDSTLQRDELLAQKQVMDSFLPLYNKLETDLDEQLITINNELDKIEDNLTASRFERWIFDLLQGQNATVVDASMGEMALASPDASFYVKNDPMYDIKSMINQINGITMTQAIKPTTESQLMKATYTYTIEADYTTYADILDDITGWQTTFFVNSSSYDFEGRTGVIVIDAYTIDKIETLDDSRYEPHYPSTGLNDASDVNGGTSGGGSGTGTGTNTGTGTGTGTNTGTNTDPDIDDEDDNDITHFPGDSGTSK